MANDGSDLELRKQLLLTRIALERVQWTHDVQTLRTASNPRNIISGAVRSMVPSGLVQALFGASRGAGDRLSPSLIHRVLKTVIFVRRYPVLVTLAGGFLARRAVRRVLIIGTFGAALAYGLSITRSRRSQLPGP